MANKYVKDLTQNTNPDGTDAFEIDDGTNSEYVTLNNMFNGAPTRGDTIYFNGTKWVRAPAGADGYVWTSTGAGSDPAWEATASVSTRTIEGCQLIWNSSSSISVGTGVCYAENGDKIDITSTLTDASFSRANSTWYYVYVYLSSGTPTMEVVTTAPAAWKGTAYSKTSDTSRRYIGSIRTDSSANVFNFEHTVSTNQISYRLQPQATTFRVLSSGTATTATSVSCASFIPSTVSLAYLRFFNSADQGAFFGGATLTTTAYQIAINLGSVTPQSNYTYVNLDASQVIYYMIPSRTTGVSHIDVFGYIYNR